MAKFNLNQILNDASRAAAKGGEPTPRPAESRMEKISVYDLVPSEDNFYSIREIEELKAAIEIAGKVLQTLSSSRSTAGNTRSLPDTAAALRRFPLLKRENRNMSSCRATWNRTKKRRKIKRSATALC